MDLIINNKNLLQVALNDNNNAQVNGIEKTFDLIKIANDEYHMLVQNKSYTIKVLGKLTHNANTTLQINGTNFEVHTKDNLEKVLEKMGMSLNGSAKIKDLKAPMPGLVLNVLVKIGQSIQKDEPILVLEAMKMENVIKSPVAGVIENISINNGEKVDKNQVLITFA